MGIIAAFMSLFIRELHKMTALLQASLKEARTTESTRAINEATQAESRKTLDALNAQTRELKQHIYNGNSH